MEQGRIIDRGRPHELRSRHPGFFSHWRAQVVSESPISELRA